MDKQLLKALDNLYFALDEIAEALNKGKSGGAQSATANALVSSNLEEHFKEINISLKSIKSDTQEILKNQKTLLSMSKSADKKTGVFEEAGGDKKSEGKIKQGVGTILLIAVAVLAIGLAFKIVGKVDFLSVIALSISIVLIAVAFEKIAKLELTPRQAMIASAVMVIGSLGIMISSYILSKIAPVSIVQMLTAAVISGLFLLIAPSIAKMIKAMTTSTEVEFRGMKVKSTQLEWGTLLKSVVMVPFLMVSMSIGITLSSMILKIISDSIPDGFPYFCSSKVFNGSYIFREFEMLLIPILEK
jgi:DNA-binding transcriptional MerR regulator